MGGRPAAQGHDDDGATLVEMVVAIVVLTIVLTSAMVSLVGSTRVEVTNRRADTAQRLAQTAAERAAVFECGVLPAVTDAAVLGAQRSRCGGSLGARTWTQLVEGTTFTLTLDVQWVETSPNSNIAAGCTRMRLQRSVRASWTQDTTTYSRTATLVTGLPVDSVAQLRRGLIEVSAAPDRLVALSLPGGFLYPIRVDASGVARFPFLATETAHTVGEVDTGGTLIPAKSFTRTPAAVSTGCSKQTVSIP
jgi:type II secretory pathway pseudopilin PulG